MEDRLAVIYARYSPRPKLQQRKTKTIEVQVELCTRFAEANGHQIIDTQTDENMSGNDPERPGLKKALAAVKKYKAVLIVYKLDRLTRSLNGLLTISAYLKKYNGALASVTEHFDTSTPYGKFFFHLLGALAELVREQASERTSEALRAKLARGESVCAIPPYGMEFDPDSPIVEGGKIHSRLQPNLEEMKTLGVMVEMRKQGMSYRAICRALDKMGLKMRGGRWHHSTVHRILRREDYRSVPLP